jgi:hypothetical protein
LFRKNGDGASRAAIASALLSGIKSAYLGGNLNKKHFPTSNYVRKDKRIRCDDFSGKPCLCVPLDGTQDPFEAIDWLLAETERAIAALR